MTRVEPFYTAHLFPELDRLLLDCLRKLTPADWERRTLATRWSVKDVAAHLLDSNIRASSILRDGTEVRSTAVLIHMMISSSSSTSSMQIGSGLFGVSARQS